VQQPPPYHALSEQNQRFPGHQTEAEGFFGRLVEELDSKQYEMETRKQYELGARERYEHGSFGKDGVSPN
jgi:hypothetical protein